MKQPGTMVWNGKQMVTTNFTSTGSLAMVVSLKKSFRNYSLVESDLNFNGTVVADVGDVDNVST